MIAKSSTKVLIIVFVLLLFNFSESQENTVEETTKINTKSAKFLDFYNLRGTNSFDIGIGSSIINGDFEDPLFEIYFKAGYKRFLSPHLNLGLTYHKFNLAYDNLFNNGFMSIDFNLEYLVLPHKSITPYIFLGGGYLATNYFEDTTTKVQVGTGLEFILYDGFGISVFADYNYAFDDSLDGLVAGASDDTFFRMGLGLQFYFGGSKKREKLYGDQKTVINSNLLSPSNTTKITK
ncbi:Curli production assembly/transport component CsgG [Ichthyenterobacterium sp. W332]|uniref:Curli production assembly/transport component CsgG n=1 Tax=Microcosmobacter mediterraneus TaxID=3075607 RepID=A0ABU2YM81_9FLAO|nr:Curli production assembly/transport component CsgG [Ichthyenterobacterium sp. W332]MDT0559265.1 Curli production assembly/transport component CsgG [Ichthyenterobacterium sp. W332]